MFRITVYSLTAILATSSLVSCGGINDTDGRCPEAPIALIDGIESVSFGRIVDARSDSVPIQFYSTDQTSTLNEGAKALSVNMSYEQQASETSWLGQFDFQLIKSANALSCRPVVPASKVDLSDVQVVSNIQFNDALPAGSNLIDFFSIIDVAVSDPYQDSLPSSFDGSTLSSYVTETDNAPLSFILKFDGDNAKLVEQTLTVSVSVDNGQRSYTTDVLVF